MQPNEFIPAFVLLAAAFCGWKLLRFVRFRSTVIKVVGSVSGIGILLVSGCLLLFYGCRMAITNRSAPSISPDHEHMAQVISRELGPGPAYTEVQLRSRWQVWPETVFASADAPQEIETKWPSGSELVIRYAAGYPSDRDYPVPCERQFKTVKITCEPVAGCTLHPDSTASSGQQLRAAIDQRYTELCDAHAIGRNGVQITDVVLNYITMGTPLKEADAILMAGGFLVSRRAPNQNPPSANPLGSDVAKIDNYGACSGCRVGVNVALYPPSPTDYSTASKIAAWIIATCP